MQYLKLPPIPCYCCRVQLMLCIIQFRFFSGMVQYMLVFSTSVEVASKRHLVKSFYSAKCSHNPSGIILTRIGCLAPAGCTVSVCIQLHWQNSCFRKSHIRSFEKWNQIRFRCQFRICIWRFEEAEGNIDCI